MKDEKFEELYAKLANEYGKELEKQKREVAAERKQNNKILMIVFVIIFLIAIIVSIFILTRNTIDEEMKKNMSGFIMIGAFVMIAVIYGKMSKHSKTEEFWNNYKSKIMIPIIKSFNDTLEYRTKEGILSEVYKNAEFEEYNIYSSGNLITGNIEKNCKIEIAEVTSEYKYIDGNNETHIKPRFDGIFVAIEAPKPFQTKVYIRQDRKEGNVKKLLMNPLSFDHLRQQLDSQEFEEHFDVYAENPVIAMQLLTSDIMQMLVEFYKEIGNMFEVTIKNDYIYIRLWDESILKVNSIKGAALEKENVYRNYKVLEFIVNLSEEMVKLINETQY